MLIKRVFDFNFDFHFHFSLMRNHNSKLQHYKHLTIAFLFLFSFMYVTTPLSNYTRPLISKITKPAPPPFSTQFIKKYQDLAVKEMKRTGVPASITMAQAILETGFGRSDLAKEGKNYFGIKQRNLKKCKYLYKGDYYRCYESPTESFIDHSNFLANKKLMKKLIKLKKKHYKHWTATLTKIKYAEDPLYESKLNNIIERYDLYLLDKPQVSFFCNILK